MSHDNIQQYVENTIAAARKLASLPVIANDIDASARIERSIGDLESLRCWFDVDPEDSSVVLTMAMLTTVVQSVDDSMAELQRVLACAH